jgi:hypothetical protein
MPKRNIVVVLITLLGACSAPRSTASGSPTSTSSKAAPSVVDEPAVANAPAPPTPALPGPVTPTQTVWTKTFEDDAPDAAPVGFSFANTGPGRPARWIVRAETDAPSARNVLAQLDEDATNDRFSLAITNEPSLRNVRVSVRCKTVSGRVDQACGLVARYIDENNYFVTRANALEGNIRLYAVRNGKRSQLASWTGRITPKTWHELRFELRGDKLEVLWDGQRVLDHQDATFTEAGRTGLWTKADSVAYFDELRIEALP